MYTYLHFLFLFFVSFLRRLLIFLFQFFFTRRLSVAVLEQNALVYQIGVVQIIMILLLVFVLLILFLLGSYTAAR